MLVLQAECRNFFLYNFNMLEKEASDLLETKAPISVAIILVFRPGDLGLEFLLAERQDAKFKKKLACPGGRLELGESAAEAAQRELFEETGLAIVPENLKEIKVSNSFIWDGRSKYKFYFFSLFFSGDDIEIGNPEGKHEWSWYTLDQIYELVEKNLLLPISLTFFQTVSKDKIENLLYS